MAGRPGAVVANSYDVVIIGAGHNGLVASAYLARAGLKVLVLERRHVIGGACVTEEIWPGFRVNTAAYLCGLLQPKIIRDLDLGHFGYEILPKDPAFFSPFPDGRHLFVWRDEEATSREIARYSARDARRYPEYEAFLARIAAFAEPWLLQSPPDLLRRRWEDLLMLGRLGVSAMRLAPGDLVQALRLMSQSAADFLDSWFDSPELKSSLATDGVIGARGGPSTPGTAYVLFHHCMGQAAGKRGLWGFVRGGMGQIVEALAASARRYGAQIRTTAEVAEILVRADRVQGVLLAGGEEVRSRVVVSNADPKRTFLKMLPASTLPPDFLEDVGRIRMDGVAMKINLATDALPHFLAAPKTGLANGLGPEHRATIHIGPSIEYIDRAWQDARAGRPSAEPFAELTIPTVYDPSLAPPGKHAISIFVQYTPYSLADGAWDEMKESYADRVMDAIAQYAPNIRDIVLHRQVLTPVDLEREFALTGGDIFHGEMTPDRLFFLRPVPGWARYRTPIVGLYLCGAGTHPGGGVMGAPGHNAAREILRDWKR